MTPVSYPQTWKQSGIRKFDGVRTEQEGKTLGKNQVSSARDPNYPLVHNSGFLDCCRWFADPGGVYSICKVLGPQLA